MSAGSRVASRLKRVIRPVRDVRPLVSAVEWIGEYQYRGKPAGLGERCIARVLTLNRLPQESRDSSVEALVELFFSLVEVTGVERFVEAGAKDAGASRRAATGLGIADVVAFEANPYTHRRFVDTVSDDGIDYRHRALSETAGEMVFLVRLDDAGKPMADGQGSLLVRPDHVPGYEPVPVTAERLDRALGDDSEPRTAMWVDVEGASAQVLRGAVGMLGTVNVVMIEVESDRRWDEQEWIDHDVVEFFSSVGLRPVARDRQSRLQYNIVFARLEDPRVTSAVDRWRTDRPS